MTERKEVVVTAINIFTNQVLLDDGSVCQMTSFHEFGTGDEVDSDIADFATFPVPGGGWSYVLFKDFEESASID